MQKRIEYLNNLIQPIVERMRGYPAFDTVGYNDLKAQRSYLQNEIDWLTAIQRDVKLPIEGNSFTERFHQIEMQLTIAPQTIISPLNKMVYAIEDARATRMHTLDIERMSYSFTYSVEVIGKTPPQMIAEQITRSYLRGAKQLDDMLEGVRFANIALQYFNDMQNGGFGFTTIDFKLQHAAHMSNYELRYEGEELEIFDAAVANDDYLKHVKLIAKDYWTTTRKLIAFTLLEGRYNIDWQPFGYGLATSRP